jgi:hypothetical protein
MVGNNKTGEFGFQRALHPALHCLGSTPSMLPVFVWEMITCITVHLANLLKLPPYVAFPGFLM